MDPYFSGIEDTNMFYKQLDKTEIYFEFGSGGSTYQAAIRNNIKKIFSIESDKVWHEKLQTLIHHKSHIHFIYNELNTKPNTWGHPGPNCTIQQKKIYSNQILLIDKNIAKNISLILIDGRFRVACCLKCFNVISDNCVIAFDDFIGRKQYHIVLNYYNIIEQTSTKNMVFLKKKPTIQFVPKEIIEKYELIAD